MSTENQKVQLIEQLLYIDDDDRLKKKVIDNDEQFDYEFFDILTDFIHSAQMRGNEPLAASLWEMRTKLEIYSSTGKSHIAKIDQERQMVIIRDQDDLLARLRSADTAQERAQLVATGYDLINDKFFRQLSFHINEVAQSNDPAGEQKLRDLRDEIYDLKAKHERSSQVALEEAETLFKKVIQAKRPDRVLERRAAQINEAFFFVVGTNIAKARNQGQEEIAKALETIGTTAAGLMQARQHGANGPIA